MPNFVHGRKTKVFCNQFDLSRFFKTAEVNGEAPAIDSTTFDATARTFIPDYIDGAMSLSGLWSASVFGAPTPQDVDDVLGPLLGVDADQLFLIAQEGAAAALLNCQLALAKETKYSVSAPTNNLVSAAAELKANGAIRQGILLAEQVARIANGNGTVHDNGAASANGAIAQIHLTSIAGTSSPTLTVVIEDSADGATGWATIGSFTALTAIGSQRISIAGAVRQYTRARWTITGTSPSFLFVAGLARI